MSVFRYKQPFMLVAIILASWIVFAASCMKLRVSDTEANKQFAAAGVELHTKFTNINGFKLHYAQTGNDTLPTLLFVHGTPGSWDAFEYYLRNKELLKYYRIISVDRPGFGYSGFGTGLPLAVQTGIIAGWMDSIYNNHPIIIIGHSLGGPMVVKLSAARPQYIKAMVILAGSLDPAAEKVEKWRPILFKTPLNLLVPGALRPSNEELWYLKKDLKEMDEDYDKINCPVFILHGKADKLVPYSNVAYAQKKLTKARVSVTSFENENHFIVWTRQKEITALLLQLRQLFTP